MKISCSRPGRPGYVAYAMVIGTSTILILASFFAYRSATNARDVQTSVRMRVDYSEKEDAILRSIVAIAPNRAMRAMMNGSNANDAARNPLRWKGIFEDSLNMANARTSVSNELLEQIGDVGNLRRSNVGDNNVLDTADVFHEFDGTNDGDLDSYCSSGLNRNWGTGFPVPLQSANNTTVERDSAYPVISADKRYGSLAEGQVGLSVNEYPDFNLIPYPQINFGYAMPGQPFLAKRNWWAFEMDLAGADREFTKLMRPRRKFVFSIYEIPSQLAISSSAFMSLGRYGSGDAWENVSIEGNIFAGRARVEGNLALSSLASRRGMELDSTARIGGESFVNDPFAAGTRENYQITTGEFYPVSLASESGRVAFLPINRGADFFDRFAHTTEGNTVSPTTWNQYTVGALQCAMSLDITRVNTTNGAPTEFRFRAKPNIDFRQPVATGISASLPPGYTQCAQENQSYDFGDQVVDVAYGSGGNYFFQSGVTGVVFFNTARFGNDPNPTNEAGAERGYWRLSAPFRVTTLPSGERVCVEVMPELFPAYLASIGASDTSVNHSIAVNVDYTTTGLNNSNFNPIQPDVNGIPRYLDTFPGGIKNFGLILTRCSNLTVYPKGFSVVSNLRTYLGDDFNTTPATPPSGYTPARTFYPPVSLYVPEKRFGVDEDPYAVTVAGQVGSLADNDRRAGAGADEASPVHVLDVKSVTEREIDGGQIQVNLTPIDHPAALPPITMMNWLVMIEELRGEHNAAP